MRNLNTTKPNMMQMLVTIDEWKDKYHHDKGTIVFQNKNLLSNIRFTDLSLHRISDNSRGFENLPDCLTNPDEVWSYWKDTDKQDVVLRNYIVFGEKYNYVVQTENGVIQNAFLTIPSETGKYRKGVLLIK